jgi:hypothetical protein
LFAELDAGGGGKPMMDLEGPLRVEPSRIGGPSRVPPSPRVADAGAPRAPVNDRAGTKASPAASRSSSRMVIEALEDGEWPDPPAELEEIGGKDDSTQPIVLGSPKLAQAPRVALVRDHADDADKGTGSKDDHEKN